METENASHANSHDHMEAKEQSVPTSVEYINFNVSLGCGSFRLGRFVLEIDCPYSQYHRQYISKRNLQFLGQIHDLVLADSNGISLRDDNILFPFRDMISI